MKQLAGIAVVALVSVLNMLPRIQRARDRVMSAVSKAYRRVRSDTEAEGEGVAGNLLLIDTFVV